MEGGRHGGPAARKNLFLADKGTVLTWFFVMAQTGDVFSLHVNEYDLGDPSQPSANRALTRFASFPSFTVVSISLPGHLLPDVNSFSVSRTFP